MTLLLAISSVGDGWSLERWRDRFKAALPDYKIVAEGIDDYDPRDITNAAVWKPAPGLLARLPELQVIFNLGAGVDALLADATLPSVPLVRAVNADLTRRMTEYVTLHVLLHHRRLPMLQRAQAAKQWLPKNQWAASAVRVGILGFGTLGRDAAEVLTRIGFQVAGWSRAPRPLAGVDVYAGVAELGAFLGRTDILVALLPLTPETRGILNRGLFSQLARDGVLGAPVLINAGRGGLHVEADILAALDTGCLSAASLDVFETEPLPAVSRLWSHPSVIVTPHNAADSDADAIAVDVAGQIVAYGKGLPLRNIVDRKRGY